MSTQLKQLLALVKQKNIYTLLDYICALSESNRDTLNHRWISVYLLLLLLYVMSLQAIIILYSFLSYVLVVIFVFFLNPVLLSNFTSSLHKFLSVFLCPFFISLCPVSLKLPMPCFLIMCARILTDLFQKLLMTAIFVSIFSKISSLLICSVNGIFSIFPYN